MNLWLAKAVRMIVLLTAVIIVGALTFDKILKKAEPLKPKINLIPEEIKSTHFINSYPLQNQFFVGTPPNIVINFDTKLKNFSSNIDLNGKKFKTTDTSSEKSIIIKPNNFFENGIVLVSYKVCFNDNTCSDGQFSFHMDDTRLTEFANFTVRNFVEINIDGNTPSPANILVNYQATIQWNNKTQNTIEINSQPPIFNNYFPELNSGEIKPGESFKYLFNDKGEYIWYLKSNPNISGRILVG
jgi:methionine-rich copper-binding protein CopC